MYGDKMENENVNLRLGLIESPAGYGILQSNIHAWPCYGKPIIRIIMATQGPIDVVFLENFWPL